MSAIMRGLIGLLSLLYLFLAGSFLLNPVESGADFALSPIGAQGLASLRADFTAYFLVTGGTMLWGAVTNRPMLYWVAIAILGITFCGRAFSLVVDGAGIAPYPPMAVEAMTVVLLLIGLRVQRQT
ncbi:MAG: hypothetical protein AAFX04_11455 [Pseudomonadota bacterium]